MKIRCLLSLSFLAVGCLVCTPARAALLLAGFSADQIYSWDGVSPSTTLFASDPSMDGPTAMVYDSAGNLLVLNEFSKNVLKFNGTTGALIGTLITSTSLGAVISDPDDMELGPDGNLYIMGHGADGLVNIHRFNGTSGAYIGAFSTVAAD